MPPQKNKRRSTKKLVLIVVEGHVEKAFISMLKSYYARPNFKVTIDNQRGGSSDKIVNHTCNESLGYDVAAVVIDGDVATTRAVDARAKRCNIRIIRNMPCIEATLLKILGAPAPDTTKSCKREFKNNVGDNATYRGTYEEHYPKQLIDDKLEEIIELKMIVRAIQGSPHPE